MEIWKDIPDYEGLYQISNLGRVKSKKNKILTPRLEKKGYVHYSLYKDGIPHNAKGHRIVAKVFIPNPNNLPQVNHINGIKTDNRAENLEWCNCKDNIIHAFNTNIKKNPKYGEHPEARKIAQYDLDDNLIKVYDSISQARDENNYNSSKICACCRGKQETSFGYKWKYIGGV